jgi:hypothetical protein
VVRDALEDHPYLNRPTSKQRRGLLNLVGEWDHKLFGLATDRQIDELHVTELRLAERQKSLQDAILKDHKYLTEVTSNISTWTASLSKTFEADLDDAKRRLEAAIDTVYKEDGVLGDISSTILKNQHVMYVTNKIDSAAESCRWVKHKPFSQSQFYM